VRIELSGLTLRLTATVLVILLFAGVSMASAQTTRSAAATLNPPWPRFVVDLRGATSAIPDGALFYPPLPPDSLVPARGFGIEAGAQLYAGHLGGVRLGYGGSYYAVRATQGGLTTVNARFLTPQVSLNFGSSRGWSYVSGGAGIGTIRGEVTVDGVSASRSSGTLTTPHIGGGARWFFTSHVAFTFDLRLLRAGRGVGNDGIATGSSMLTSATIGVSLK
jgi:hypothetical protein